MDYPRTLLIVFLAYWIAWAIRPRNRRVWLAENSFTVACVAVLAATYPVHSLSRASYTLIFAFLCMHTIGGHYTYSEVPYDRWVASLSRRRGARTGKGSRRNHYDRLVHFCFGLLWAHPIREVLVEVAGIRGAWSYVLATSVVMATSMLFELAEWAAGGIL